MKKLVVLLLVALLAFSFVGCKSAAAPAATEPAAQAGKVYNVANLVNGNLGDKSFFDSAESGLKALQDAGRITYKTIEMGATDADQPKWLETLYEVAESGEYDLIICGTYQMPDNL